VGHTDIRPLSVYLQYMIGHIQCPHTDMVGNTDQVHLFGRITVAKLFLLFMRVLLRESS